MGIKDSVPRHKREQRLCSVSEDPKVGSCRLVVAACGSGAAEQLAWHGEAIRQSCLCLPFAFCACGMGRSWRRGELLRWVNARKGMNSCAKEPPYLPNGEGRLLGTGEEVLWSSVFLCDFVGFFNWFYLLK